MAFDTATRNRLNQFVGDARELLTDEFTNQFQVDYGMDPESGEVADLERLSHLDDARRQTAVILRDTLAHYYTNLPTKQKKQEADFKQLIQRIIGEQAFTILNRLCAIRMAEARDLVIESVAVGLQSKGFQLYQPIVGNSLGDTGASYKQYLLCLFDEFAVDLPVLFDRFSPQGRLFPRESVLAELLDLINNAEINRLWTEDETIGWIYQYFNSKEERKAMRDASQAPRNSRELAVRNQFFTPRYVVEFLSDNTLGRIWYEMRKGETRLKDECQYLVRRPIEIFLEEGEDAPETELAEQEKNFTQEELLNQPVHIPHRPLKDPREIRMLDPACGSMHFGLYAFDLYLKIYEEYWDLVAPDPSVAIEPTDLPPLTKGYESRDCFLRDVPKLIIEHNIHGIDIDPRAVQIAGLSLWLRAQRAWKSQGLAAGDRPQVERSNVVCAEPMPGNKQQLEAFCEELHPAIAQMVTAIFEEMKLTGEAGSLLKIEQEISSLVAAAKKQFQDKPPDQKTQLDFFGGTSIVQEQQLEFDLSGITDEQFFKKAEVEIYEVLRKYSSESSEDGFRRKLFANDAEKGFAFIDVARQKFDVVLMNPPFGLPTPNLKRRLRVSYPATWKDMYAAFSQRGLAICTASGLLGIISPTMWIYSRQLREFRHEILGKGSPHIFVELGGGVMDDAAVEASLWTASPMPCNTSACVLDLLGEDSANRAERIVFNLRSWNCVTPHAFSLMAEQPFAFHLTPRIVQQWNTSGRLEPDIADVAKGNTSFDDFRFLRLWWEILQADFPSSWKTYRSGGDFQPFVSPSALMINWRDEGAEVRIFNTSRHGSDAQAMQSSKYWFRKGIAYPRVGTAGFGVRVANENEIFSGHAIFVCVKDEADLFPLLAFLNTKTAIRFFESHGRHRMTETIAIKDLPLRHEDLLKLSIKVNSLASDAIENVNRFENLLEESRLFVSPTADCCSYRDIPGLVERVQATNRDLCTKIDVKVREHFRISEIATRKPDASNWAVSVSDQESADRMVSYCLGCAFGRFGGPIAAVPNVADVFGELPFKFDSGGERPSIYEHTATTSCLADSLSAQLDTLYQSSADTESKIEESLGVSSLREYFQNPNGFFAAHLARYSKYRRAAPIYWPISTESSSYTLWFYYHRLTDQTLYKAVNDFVDPKFKETVRQLGDLRAIKDRSSAQEKELAQLTELESELEQFKADLLEIAAFWKPNLNDGVQITAAPLHKFFRLKKWRDKLAKTWKELQDGKYDWAHLALSIWPDRVVKEKCTIDRSIAIAHNLEDQLWHEVEVVKTSKSSRVTTKMEWQPRKLTDAELDSIVKAVKSGKHPANT